MSDENIINEKKTKLNIPYKPGTKEYSKEYRKIKKEELKKAGSIVNVFDRVDIENTNDLIKILNNKKEELDKRDKRIKNLLKQIVEIFENDYKE